MSGIIMQEVVSSSVAVVDYSYDAVDELHCTLTLKVLCLCQLHYL